MGTSQLPGFSFDEIQPSWQPILSNELHFPVVASHWNSPLLTKPLPWSPFFIGWQPGEQAVLQFLP